MRLRDNRRDPVRVHGIVDLDLVKATLGIGLDSGDRLFLVGDKDTVIGVERAAPLNEAGTEKAGPRDAARLDIRFQAIEDKKAVEADTEIVKKEIGEVELKIQKVQQECANRDHTIKTLNEVIENIVVHAGL